MESVGHSPASSARPVIGDPMPIFSSTSGLIDSELPTSASIRSSSSLRPLPCTNVAVSRRRPCSRRSATAPPTMSTCRLVRRPSSAASCSSRATMSMLVASGPRSPHATVTRPSAARSERTRRMAASTGSGVPHRADAENRPPRRVRFASQSRNLVPTRRDSRAISLAPAAGTTETARRRNRRTITKDRG